MSTLDIIDCPEWIEASSGPYQLRISLHDSTITTWESCNDANSPSASDFTPSHPNTPPQRRSQSPHIVDISVRQSPGVIESTVEDKIPSSLPSIAPPSRSHAEMSTPAQTRPLHHVVQLTSPALHTGETWTVYHGKRSTQNGHESVILKFAPASDFNHVLREYSNLVQARRSAPNLHIPKCYGLFWNSTLVEGGLTTEQVVEMFGHPYQCGSFVMMSQYAGEAIEEWIDLDEACQSKIVALVKSCAEARLYIDGSLRTNHFCKDDENEGTVSFVDLSEASWIEEANYNDKKAFLDCQVFTIENYLMISTKIPYVDKRPEDSAWSCLRYEPADLSDIDSGSEDQDRDLDAIANLRVTEQVA